MMLQWFLTDRLLEIHSLFIQFGTFPSEKKKNLFVCQRVLCVGLVLI